MNKRLVTVLIVLFVIAFALVLGLVNHQSPLWSAVHYQQTIDVKQRQDATATEFFRPRLALKVEEPE